MKRPAGRAHSRSMVSSAKQPRIYSRPSLGANPTDASKNSNLQQELLGRTRVPGHDDFSILPPAMFPADLPAPDVHTVAVNGAFDA
ncbi:hypothetical protein VTI28DRAFT_7124 [Corynascus sepedonium]